MIPSMNREIDLQKLFVKRYYCDALSNQRHCLGEQKSSWVCEFVLCELFFSYKFTFHIYSKYTSRKIGVSRLRQYRTKGKYYCAKFRFNSVETNFWARFDKITGLLDKEIYMPPVYVSGNWFYHIITPSALVFFGMRAFTAVFGANQLPTIHCH